ncbi:Mercaptopyruvate sulfurtransferase/thiosulfate sulfurtransferase [Phaffia rhodozyma]|uniref:Mercaptopyruvate sulfurtransferase/thiosulfate sulfurtransferase n=1 Tax=Phaffia rhodozyma TaxID=264483 RepID=A0A0F7SL15_PHARH|nr:Mercaptopyruvate sulfurtransferase/thiosulfate sulfurtransferase [Phaffia rhodozyma]
MLRKPSLISPRQLLALSGKTVIPLDASWHMPNSSENALQNFQKERIPKARFFDLDKVASAHDLGLAHMLPTPEIFAKAAANLAIEPSSHIVLYDTHGLFSSSRAAFTFWAMGHPGEVSILNGGLPGWKAEGFEVETGSPASFAPTEYPTPKSVVDRATVPYADVLSNCSSKVSLVLDARPRPRWTGQAPEPRQGLESGHMPGSVSLPFGELVKDGKLIDDDAITKKLREILGDRADAVLEGKQDVIASCGSGMTAATIWLALQRLNISSSIYDESWTGWASRPETSPIVKGEE